MLYGTARFNAFVSAGWVNSREEMTARREEIVGYFVNQYRAVLEEHVDDYIQNFESYMTQKS